MTEFRIETPRLRLTHLSADDAAFTLQLLNERGFIDNIGDRGVRTLEDARQYLLTKPMASYGKNGYGLYRVALKSTGEPVGMSGLVKRDALEHPDIGYAFLEKFHRQGYAHESALAVRDHGARALGIRRLLALIKPDNQASVNLLLKLDFRGDAIVQLPGIDGGSRLMHWDA